MSILLLLFTANGIFEPLEVALNRAWGISKDRSYAKNQILSFGLILLCGGLALTSFLLTAMNREFMTKVVGRHRCVGAALGRHHCVPAGGGPHDYAGAVSSRTDSCSLTAASRFAGLYPSLSLSAWR